MTPAERSRAGERAHNVGLALSVLGLALLVVSPTTGLALVAIGGGAVVVGGAAKAAAEKQDDE